MGILVGSGILAEGYPLPSNLAMHNPSQSGENFQPWTARTIKLRVKSHEDPSNISLFPNHVPNRIFFQINLSLMFPNHIPNDIYIYKPSAFHWYKPLIRYHQKCCHVFFVSLHCLRRIENSSREWFETAQLIPGRRSPGSNHDNSGI